MSRTRAMADKAKPDQPVESPKFNNTALQLSTDQDTTITSDTDNRIDFAVNNTDVVRMHENARTSRCKLYRYIATVSVLTSRVNGHFRIFISTFNVFQHNITTVRRALGLPTRAKVLLGDYVAFIRLQLTIVHKNGVDVNITAVSGVYS